MMPTGQFLLLLPYIFSVLISLGIAGYAWSRRHVPGAFVFTCLLLSEAANSIAYIFEMLDSSLEGKLFWDNVQWFTYFLVVILNLVFVYQFTRLSFRKPLLWLLAVCVFPAIFLISLAIDPTAVRTDEILIGGAPFTILDYRFAVLSYLAGLYFIVITLAAIGMLVWRISRANVLYRHQLLTILFGMVVPLVGGILALANITLAFQRDITPITFAIGYLIIAWGLFRYQLFEIAPVARAAVFEHFPDAVVVVDNRDRLIDYNRAAVRFLGNPPDGKLLAGYPLAASFTEWNDISKALLNTNEIEEHEIRLTRADIQRTYTLAVSPIRLNDDSIGGRIIWFKDITERKQIEEELRQRTLELDEARQRAENADEQKTRFLSAMSHELRTPLNAVINFNQFVSQGLFGSVNEKQADALRKSTASARHLLELVNELLDLSKIESGHFELMLESQVDLHPEIDEAVAVTRSLIGDKPIQFNVEIEENLPAVMVDRRRILQVLLNLLSNAAKFTEVGYINLQIWYDKEKLLFAIRDSGAGIPSDQQDLIFEPFRQLKGDMHKPGSTGLGLPIARKLVEAHGGDLWLESKAGEGSTFFFSVPLQSVNSLAAT